MDILLPYPLNSLPNPSMDIFHSFLPHSFAISYFDGLTLVPPPHCCDPSRRWTVRRGFSSRRPFPYRLGRFTPRLYVRATHSGVYYLIHAWPFVGSHDALGFQCGEINVLALSEAEATSKLCQG